jgi:hypothetical protein
VPVLQAPFQFRTSPLPPPGPVPALDAHGSGERAQP